MALIERTLSDTMGVADNMGGSQTPEQPATVPINSLVSSATREEKQARFTELTGSIPEAVKMEDLLQLRDDFKQRVDELREFFTVTVVEQRTELANVQKELLDLAETIILLEELK